MRHIVHLFATPDRAKAVSTALFAPPEPGTTLVLLHAFSCALPRRFAIISHHDNVRTHPRAPSHSHALAMPPFCAINIATSPRAGLCTALTAPENGIICAGLRIFCCSMTLGYQTSWRTTISDALRTRLTPRFCAVCTTINVADAILLESAAPINGVTVAVLQECIAGTVVTQEDLDCVRKRLAFIKKDLHTVAGFSKKRFSPESLAARLASPFLLAPTMTYPQVLTVA